MVYTAVAERLDEAGLERFERSLAEPDAVSDRALRVAQLRSLGGDVVEVA